ncbi:hypothetical protein HHL11_32240 [Ramlibacter sp. G-1-2-2]|uniref:Uncharacterized protein n=1 Tax=Ramlibacter agri TaxID=2728837 RepID=A0A848HG81_9BURK|nr:hypothetical protein [Ramlibacter agri]NML48460.1 hypothetical protein [Ramlibacter agri]
MTTIDPRQSLTAAVRSEAAAFRARSGRQPAASPGAAAPSLQSIVAQRVQALAADDPQRKQKAVRIFLESALLQELGSALAHDPAFSDLVDAVHGQMRGDAQLAVAVDQLGELLLSA